MTTASVETIESLGARLRAMNLGPRRSGTGWTCRCPVHDDRLPSLSATIGTGGRLLLYCHAGCAFPLILSALGLEGRSTPTVKVRHVPIVEPTDPSMLVEWQRIRRENDAAQVVERERALGIPTGGLARIGVVWTASLAVLAAPMYDRLCGGTVGVRLRADDGRKWAVRGSHNGLFLPGGFDAAGPVYMPEGMTDTATLAGLGLNVAGRPSATGGRKLCVALARTVARRVVVVADADKPGLDGAAILANELRSERINAKVMRPPPGHKDIRDFVACGAGREEIEYMERQS